MIENPPYVNAYGKVPSFFEAIRQAKIPGKFNHDFLSTVLGFKSSSDRAYIGLLKRINFIDQGNVPTDIYREYKGTKEQAKHAMGRALKSGYVELFKRNEYAYNLKKEDLTALIRQVTGAAADDKIVPAIVSTFKNLCDLASFEGKPPKGIEKVKHPIKGIKEEIQRSGDVLKKHRFGLSYTINLNLPPTTDIEVFNAIFKSLKENLLNEL